MLVYVNCKDISPFVSILCNKVAFTQTIEPFFILGSKYATRYVICNKNVSFFSPIYEITQILGQKYATF